MKFLPALLLLAVVLAGCSMTTMRGASATPPLPTAADLADAKRPLRCGSLEQCNRWWRTAQVWVVKAAGRVQVASDAIVQTPAPESGSIHWAYLVTRAPHPDGGEAIEIQAQCAGNAVCAPAYETAIADFKRTVAATR